MGIRHSVLRLSLASLSLGAAMSAGSAPAMAQFSDSYSFLKAVRDRDGTEATKLLQDETSRVINTKDSTTGETALSIVVQRRDDVWTRFLLGKDADPSIGDKQGMTPLMHASLIGFTDGADELLKSGAAVDQTNRRGETALILAVQTKNAAMIRLLVKNGANADRRDHVAGLSAREYAKRDDRSGQFLGLLDAKSEAAPRPLESVFGPK